MINFPIMILTKLWEMPGFKMHSVVSDDRIIEAYGLTFNASALSVEEGLLESYLFFEAHRLKSR